MGLSMSARLDSAGLASISAAKGKSDNPKVCVSVALWHNPDAPGLLSVGLPAAALPPFGREWRLTGAFGTRFRAATNAYH